MNVVTVDPKFTFYFGIWTGVMLLVPNTLDLTNMIPADLIPYVRAWASGLGTVNTFILTALTGVSAAVPGPLMRRS